MNVSSRERDKFHVIEYSTYEKTKAALDVLVENITAASKRSTYRWSEGNGGHYNSVDWQSEGAIALAKTLLEEIQSILDDKGGECG